MMILDEKIFSKLNSLVVSVDVDGRIEYVSPSVTRILGYSPEELLGEQWWSLTGYDQMQEQKSKAYLRRLSAGQVAAHELQYERLLQTKDGSDRWILWNATPTDDKVVVLGNDITERKKVESELRRKKRELEEQRNEFSDSVTYARRIQQAILPEPTRIARRFADAFVLYMPRDIVSGDSFWYAHRERTTWLAAIDCTGHGVPGAMLAVLANNLLRDIVKKRGVEDPGEILNAMDEELQAALSSEDGDPISTDGMDMSLVKWTKGEPFLEYASAFRPVIKVSAHKQVEEFAGDRFPVGYFNEVAKDFSTKRIALEPKDIIYLFSDGFPDQFGGEESARTGGKKFKKKNFKNLLASIHDLDLAEQKNFLEYAFQNWKQDLPQTDDVLVIGIQPMT